MGSHIPVVNRMKIPKTFPIVLAHGIARFDLLSNLLFKVGKRVDDKLHYFRNIRTHLERQGFTVRHSNVEWARGVDVRSKTLKKEVERILSETKAEKVHIVAHSMGGLDTRHMLFDHRKEGFHEKVASLTTLGTPHHGSSFADFLVRGSGNLISGLGLSVEGTHDLTRKAARRFNRKAEKWESRCGVRFRAYAGTQPPKRIFNPLKIAWSIIFGREGDNDGLVSVQSARWRDEYFVPPVLDADHLNLLGWWDTAELSGGESRKALESRIKSVYLAIGTTLAQEFPIS
jgi:triacylglycerol lipase